MVASDSPALSAATMKNIAHAYSLRLAWNFTSLQETLYARIVERVTIGVGSCTRQVTVDWVLPTLKEALTGPLSSLSATEVDDATSRLQKIAVPIILIRKGQLLTDLSIKSEDSSPVFLCGKEVAERFTERVLTFAWTELENSLVNKIGQAATEQHRDLLAELGKRYVAAFRMDMTSSDRELVSIAAEIKRIAAANETMIPLRQMLQVARYFTRRHVFWVQLSAKPGDSIRLYYSFVTRFAPEYDPVDGRHTILAALGKLRRFLGQTPSVLAIPISRSGLAQSYHFEMDIPHDCYVRRQAFVLETNLGDRPKLQDKAMEAYCSKHGSCIAGSDEAGGSFAHMYAYDLPPEVKNQMYAHVSFSERPPGATAVVLWMLLFATFASGIYYGLWDQVTASDSRGVDVGALFVALPALAVVWFASSFREETRRRVPLISRVGIGVIALATIYSLFSILVNRSICVGKTADGSILPPCPAAVENLVTSRGMLITFVVLLAASVVMILYCTIRHVTYRRHQRRILGKYGR